MPLHPKNSGDLIVMLPPSPCQHVPEERCFRQEVNLYPSLFVVPSYHAETTQPPHKRREDNQLRAAKGVVSRDKMVQQITMDRD